MKRPVLALLLVAACQGGGAGDPSSATFTAGLQYDGSVAFVHAAGLDLLPAGASPAHVEISAPILPDVTVLYAREGAAFPAALADEEALADDAALRFDDLLVECDADPAYADIVVARPGDPPPSPADLARNYELVAECAYVHHTSKPYWIPKLVADVDVCGRTLGADWRVLGEADVAALSTADLEFVRDTLSSADPGLGGLYFSLDAYAKEAGGHLAVAHLDPAAAARIDALPVPSDFTQHLEGGIGLRCMRSL